METVLEMAGVTKQYKRVTAVDELNLRIREGEIYGFLGPNGAGKTTAIRMIMGLVRPTSGKITLFGDPVKADRGAIFRQIGAMIEFPGFYANLTAWENLNIARRMMGIRDRSGMEEALHTVGLWEARNRKAGDFSLGMKQRLGIARAVLHRPKLLVLDEPANGLDPAGIKEMRELIRRFAAGGMTILMSSHILNEVQQIATKIGVIHQGRLVEELDLTREDERNRKWIELNVGEDQMDLACRTIEREWGAVQAAQEAGTVKVYDRVDEAAELNRLLVMQGVRVHGLAAKRESLEDYFFRLTEGGLGVHG